jgi:protein-S-isoprenylcysteine O-methyltransferase Ste14
MDTRPDTPHTEKQPNAVASILKVATAVAIFPVLMVVILFVAAGRLDWTWVWVYLGINLANISVVGPITIRNNPVAVAEHDELKKTEGWDVASVFCLLTMYIALPLVAGLDVRFGWARDPSIAWHGAGASVLAVGLGLVSWVMITNPYIWSEVPIQRGQTVCSTGAYRFVRHPAYAGLILQALSVPVLLGSLWAMIPAVAAAVSIIIATCSEDRILQAQLPGYQDYVQKVRFRLVPGIW